MFIMTEEGWQPLAIKTVLVHTAIKSRPANDPYRVDFHDKDDVISFCNYMQGKYAVVRALTGRGYRIVETSKLNKLELATAVFVKD